MRARIALVMLLTFGLIASTTGCGDDAPELTGIVRDDPLFVGDVQVTDVTEGATEPMFSFRAQPGELLVAYFGYTSCPDICPTTLAELRSAKRKIGEDAARVDLAMVTVDPERDTAEVLNGYLSSFSERYHALRPASEDELRAAEAAFLAQSSITTTPEGEVQVEHSAATYVVDENGVVVVEWPFGHGTENMASDLEVLFGEMGA